MARFGKRSLDVLSELAPDLQTLFKVVIQYVDIKLICGYRNRIAQHAAFLSDNSKVDWPNSKHNVSPSLAVDWVPFPDSGKPDDYIYLAGFIMGIGQALFMEGKMFHRLRYGGDFNMNYRTTDDGWDFGHVELITKEK